MVESHLLLMEFPGLLCLIFLFVFIIIANIFCTAILMRLISKHTKVLKLLLENELIISEPVIKVENNHEYFDEKNNNKISDSLDNITSMMEKFMWFYVTSNNRSSFNKKTLKHLKNNI